MYLRWKRAEAGARRLLAEAGRGGCRGGRRGNERGTSTLLQCALGAVGQGEKRAGRRGGLERLRAGREPLRLAVYEQGKWYARGGYRAVALTYSAHAVLELYLVVYGLAPNDLGARRGRHRVNASCSSLRAVWGDEV